MPGVEFSTRPSLSPTPVPQENEDIEKGCRDGGIWQSNQGNIGVDLMNRRAIRLEQNAKDQISYCAMGAKGEDVELLELKQRWLLAETYQKK